MDATKADLSTLATGRPFCGSLIDLALENRQPRASPRRASAAPRTNRINFITFVFCFPPQQPPVSFHPPQFLPRALSATPLSRAIQSNRPCDLVTFTFYYLKKKKKPITLILQSFFPSLLVTIFANYSKRINRSPFRLE